MKIIKIFIIFLLLSSNVIATSKEVILTGDLPPEITALIKQELTYTHKNNHIEKINKILQSFGYYSAIINKIDNIKYQEYKININNPTKITEITINLTGTANNNQQIFSKVLNPKSLQPGEIITHTNYETAKTNLLEALMYHGYLNAKFTQHLLLIDHDQAKIVLTIDSGPLFGLGLVTFNGSRYSIEYLKKFIPFSYKDDYSQDKIARLRQRLIKSNLFDKIKIEPQKDANNLLVPLKVTLIDKSRYLYTGSIGYGTDTSFRSSLGYLQRKNIHGKQLALNGYLSAIEQQISFNSQQPGKDPLIDLYQYGGDFKHSQYKNKFLESVNIYIMKKQQRNNSQLLYKLDFLNENFKETLSSSKERVRFFVPSMQWIYSNELNKKLSIEIKLANKYLLANNSFFKITTNGKIIFPITATNRIHLSGSLGHLESKDINKIPLSLRFFAGGDNSIRGYSFNSIGPKKYSNDGKLVVTGGKNLILASIEVEQDLQDKIGAALFWDSGQAMNGWHNTSLVHAIGIGARYKSPLGPIKFDIAKPLSKQHSSKNLRLHLTFGMKL